jgi:ABC-type dipeptide/oligopeptide/nickel transport system permease component
VLLATPVAWLAILALRTFAWGSPWRVVPAHGSLTLAALCLGLPAAALVARYGRASLLGARGAPFFVAARARGLGPGRALAVHALGASAASLVALLPALVAATLGAAPVVEVAFDLPGLGSVLLDASSQGDAPRLVGGALAAGALVWLASTAAALLAPVLDPRGGDGA